jgi:drug/metabolite transporter (DMT)-like permease
LEVLDHHLLLDGLDGIGLTVLGGCLLGTADLLGGRVCGFFLFVAASLQQFGLAYTTAGKAAFITTLYVVFCPILYLLVFKKKTRPIVWLCVVLDVIGLYLLCMTDASFKIQLGDTLVILCAIAFAAQMNAVDYYVERIDGMRQPINRAHIVLVALDEEGHPTQVPGLILENDIQEEEFRMGEKRKALRLERQKGGF